MKDDKETLESFEKSATEMLDGLKAFLPSIEKLKTLKAVELDEDSQSIVDEFSEKGKGLSIEELLKLKEEYLQKLDNATK